MYFLILRVYDEFIIQLIRSAILIYVVHGFNYDTAYQI